jgi:hypothetical protein
MKRRKGWREGRDGEKEGTERKKGWRKGRD